MARCRCQLFASPHSDCVYIVYSMSVVGQFVKVFMGSVCVNFMRHTLQYILGLRESIRLSAGKCLCKLFIQVRVLHL